MHFQSKNGRSRISATHTFLTKKVYYALIDALPRGKWVSKGRRDSKQSRVSDIRANGVREWQLEWRSKNKFIRKRTLLAANYCMKSTPLPKTSLGLGEHIWMDALASYVRK